MMCHPTGGHVNMAAILNWRIGNVNVCALLVESMGNVSCNKQEALGQCMYINASFVLWEKTFYQPRSILPVSEMDLSLPWN